MKDSKLEGKAILVIEGCEVTRERLSVAFEDDFKVFLAATSAEGLSKLSENINVVILDYMLPDKDGAEVLKEIKTRHPSIPVIIITGYGSEEICQKVFRYGAIDYVKKPFDTDEFKARVDLLLTISSVGSGCRQPLFLDSHAGRPENALAKLPPYIRDGIMQVKRYIDENFLSDVHVPEMARMAGMNRTYFCHYFRLITGHTFKDYLTCKRLRMAKELLRSNKLRIDEVADEVGYSSKYFSELFKKTFGVPPKRSKD
jgi:YesN/AraC family two-component response regulator